MMRDEEFVKQLKEWRHYLHEHPESAFEEENTSKYVSDILKSMGMDVQCNVGKTGVVATLKVGDGDKVIGLRADIDCIKLQEKGECAYKSQTADRMHACGHDGHTATLLGAAKLLSERKDFNGTVRFVFQPAEEPGKGAQAMIDDGLFERFPMDEIYGLHNMPQLPAGTIHTCKGGIMASEDNFVIHVKGRGGHASSPQNVIDPLVTGSQIVLSLQTIVARNADPCDTAVVSCTEFRTDGIHNAIPSNVWILGDTRSFSTDTQKLIEKRMGEISRETCKMYGAECDFQYTHEFAPTYNWPECVDVAVEAAKNVVGESKVDSQCRPLMGSEDFGRFLQKIPGCFVFIGGGTNENLLENTPLHNSFFDYNDDILVTGAEFFAELIRLRLSK